MDIRAVMERNRERMDALYASQDQTERYTVLAETFRAQFHTEPEMFVSAPGRTEVVGNHTDHNFGRVLAASVNLDTVAAVAPRGDGVIELHSAGYATPFIVDIADLAVREGERGRTFSLIRGVTARLQQLGYKVGGFNASVTSTVFKGSGLSSSAAFEVMLVAIFDALFNGWTIDPKCNAQISQYVENVYFGKPSGLLDQTASAVGGLVSMDFSVSPASVEALSYDFGKKGYSLCIVRVGGDHENLTHEYAAIPEEMKQVARAMGEEALNAVSKEQLWNALPALKGKVCDRAILRAFHFVDETERVTDAVRALKNDDLNAFFEAVIASGESSWKLLQNLYVPTGDNQEMPLALEMSRRMLQGRGAWRIHGGGFAGTILAFVPNDFVGEYEKNMNGVFGENATMALAIRPEGVVCIR